MGNRLRCQAFLRYICDASREIRRWPANSTITTIFPAPSCSTPTARARAIGINMFCMSLMKDENRKAFKANEAEYLEEVQADAGADRGRPQARLQPHARTRRQYLFHRQARRDRRPFVPASRRRHDRLEPARIRQYDAGRRPHGRRQPLRTGKNAVKFCAEARPRSRERRRQNRKSKARRQQNGSQTWPGSSQE